MSARTPALFTLLLLIACSDPSQPESADHEKHVTLRASEATATESHPGRAAGMTEVIVPDHRRQLLGVRTAQIGVRPLVREIRAVGVVSADERRVRRVQSRVEGWVEELFVSFTGERVEAGEPILAIYSPELLASQRELVLALGAAEGDGATRSHGALVEAARNRLRRFGMSEANIRSLERAREPQARVVLHAPSAGTVTLKSVLAGSFIEPQMELFTIADLSRVWVWAELNEHEIPLVSLGQRARIDLPASPGPREAEVSFVQPTLSSETRTLRVRFELDNADGALRPGMYATVRIEHALGDVLALPEEAVIDTGVRRVVFVETQRGLFQPREVELGRSGGGQYEVRAGVTAGERVVVSAQFLLDSESRLRGAGGVSHGAH